MFLSPTQLGVADLSLIADEGASFLAVADTSDTVSRLGPAPSERGSRQDLSSDSSSASAVGEGGQSGGVSVLLRGLEVGDGQDQAEQDHLALAQSTILPIALTSSHRRALQPYTALSRASAGFAETTLICDESSRADVSLLNCSTASFQEHRDSPRKPRLLSTPLEDWSLEEEPNALQESVDRRTPRPPRRAGRISDATSEGDSFRLDGFQTSGLDTGM